MTHEFKRWDLINFMIELHGYQSYLEIGYQSGICFEQINIAKKTAVDPDLNCNAPHQMTSDEFFSQNTDTYDIVFVDGLHHADQVYKDVMNSLKVLNPGGTIICHDMLPTSEEATRVPRPMPPTIWYGSTWIAGVKLNAEHDDLVIHTVNMDCGCMVIQRGDQPAVDLGGQPVDYDTFCANRSKWMRTIGVTEFKQMMFDQVLKSQEYRNA